VASADWLPPPFSRNILLQTTDHLLNLYQQFIKDFESKLDPLKMIQLVNAASNQISGLASKEAFLDTIYHEVLASSDLALIDENDPGAMEEEGEAAPARENQEVKMVKKFEMNPMLEVIVMYRLQKAYLHMMEGKVEDFHEILEGVKKDYLRFMTDVSPIVLAFYYRVLATYHDRRGEYDLFYLNSLQSLAYTEEKSISQHEKLQIFRKMAVALLVSPNIFDFNELVKSSLNLETHWFFWGK
jgi:26S proteasome regulatory subunit N9